ncbi:ABC-2 transporter permease [Ruminococcus flavefaciens]|uniref:ABC-2 transporter permease n=1 Tax=Ruminococcus flavefaciens TaxID=1265 RepID=UPI0026EAB2A5|nr:ABC-2 transporter permease [Ruminococcus flavefaciens]
MTGLLYKILRINWVKLLLFFIGSMFYPAMFALLFRFSPDALDGADGNVSLLIWGVCAFLTFFFGGACQDSLFNDGESKKWAYFVASTPTGIKGHIGSKYLFALAWSMVTVTALILINYFAVDGNKDLADGSVVFIVFFYIQLLMRAAEFPLMARFGGKMGKNMKLIILGIAAFIIFAYALFGDTSAFADIDTFLDRLFNAIQDPDTLKKITLKFSIAAAAVIPVYYLSYRLSVRWYLKGVETYEK